MTQDKIAQAVTDEQIDRMTPDEQKPKWIADNMALMARDAESCQVAFGAEWAQMVAVGGLRLLNEYDAVLRGLCSFLAAGGYNSDGLIVPAVADEKIRWGIDHIIEVEKKRALSAPPAADHINDAVEMVAKPAAEVQGWIVLDAAEIQSGVDRMKWAEGLIHQLPETHDGRNSWLLNYGKGTPAPTKEAKPVAAGEFDHLSPAEAYWKGYGEAVDKCHETHSVVVEALQQKIIGFQKERFRDTSVLQYLMKALTEIEALSQDWRNTPMSDLNRISKHAIATSPQEQAPADKDAVMREICPECEHQFECFHNGYINQLRSNTGGNHD